MSEQPSDALKEAAHVYASEVLSEIGVLKALANLHQLGLLNIDDIAELRGIVQGAYRTVGIGAGLCARFMQKNDAPKEQVSEAFWSFVNESAYREIASDMSTSLLPSEAPPVGEIKHHFQLLMQCGYEIGNLHASGQVSDAFELWRQTMVTD
jgi:hypothetical protein